MERPIVASNAPVKKLLQENQTYFFCSCGRSSLQPFCDGSHKGTTFNPKPFKVESEGEVFLCQCKQSANPPYCDGSHKLCSPDSVGKPL